MKKIELELENNKAGIRFIGFSPFWNFLIILMFLSANVWGQQTKKITGTVTDKSGQPLPGATVVEQGTMNGTVTNGDGVYNISTTENAVLGFSFVGMKPQTVTVGNRSQINIQLDEETIGLDEVVAIGYGTQSRAKITSSVSKVNAEEIRNSGEINPINALQGKAAGVEVRVTNGQPGASGKIIIRGGTSTNPDSDNPLYIVDGVIRPINDLNAEDIETMQVLKDAAATAIYGARGANGIVIITTKSGASGGKGQINVKYSTDISTIAKSYPFTNAEQYLWASRKAAALGLDDVNSASRLSDGAYPYSTNNISNTAHGGGFMNSKHTVEFLDDLISVEGQDLVSDLLDNQGYRIMNDPISGKRMIFKDNNYDNVMFHTGVSHNYNINFSGGNEKASIYTSLGYTNQDGIVKGTFYDRLSFLLNASYFVKDNLSVEAGVNYQYVNYKDPRGYNETINRSSRLPHTVRLYYPDGTPAIGESASSPRNILHELYYENIESKRYRTTFRFGLDWEIIKDLHFKPSASLFLNEDVYNYFESYHEFDKKREMSSYHNQDRRYMVDAVLNYNKTLADAHNINAMAGSNISDFHEFNISGSGANAPTDYIPTLNASNTEDERASTSIGDDRLVSFFGRVNYDYKMKYILGVSGRIDGSSKFSEAHKWGFFPAFTLGWNIHNEDFWNSGVLTKLKLRTSWGEAGNNVLSISDTQGAYSSGYNYSWSPGILNTTLANNSLVWETTRSIDAGFDAGFFNDRITFYADYYNKLTRDRLVSIPLARESGFNSIVANYGSVRNQGVEFELGVNAIKKTNLNWNISANFSFNRLVVASLPDNGKDKNRINGGEIYDKESGEYIMVGGLAEGERIGGIWAFHMIGVYATDEEAAQAPYDTKVSGYWLNKPAGEQKVAGDAIWEDVDSNGIIDDRDMVFMGWEAPDKVGGITNTLQWKGLTARFVMDYALGHVISNGWRARANGNARNRVMTITDVLSDNMWWEEGDQATIPRYSAASDWDNGKRNHIRNTSYSGVGPRHNYTYPNSLYIKKGDYLAFREFSLSYDLPSGISQKINMNNIQLNAGVYNIGYLTKFDGLSPERYDGGERGEYPRPRQFKFGVNLTF
ncbi:SusC/RagA family TonB-linked outer membrane protein [Maribellus maritimus]|uniref:SusC/RagA family TonB-linked outer membrane protein n=1 Tax=Maribellus maritimus TaxID=2870838 RepID=UPI001EEC2648|nr:TonB-dependent receptor [Maribellus maritimus]MCG6190641.1 TonB-dependent receptor [Maribellus maritimus]